MDPMGECFKFVEIHKNHQQKISPWFWIRIYEAFFCVFFGHEIGKHQL